MKESIFSKFDIRGKYPQEIDETIAYRLGLCLSKMISGRQVVIGTDIRENSQKLVNPLAFALEKSGFEIMFLEKVATEIVYYAVASKKLPLGIQITASHNPWDETGFKIVTDQAIPLASSNKLEELKNLFEKNQEIYNNEMPQNLKKIDLNAEYAQFTASLIPDVENLGGKVLIVSFGEAGADLANNFFAQTKVETRVVVLGKDRLGDSPPNPMLAANQELAKQEITEDFDLIVMLDGDSDRVELINPETKEVLLGDLTAAILAKAILEKKQGPIVFDLRKKMVMTQVAQEFKIPFIQTYAGFPFIKNKMMKEQAVFGGEMTGHFFYPESNYCENSMLSIALILGYLKNHEFNLTQSLSEFNNIFSIPEEVFDLTQLKDFDLTKLQNDLTQIFPNAQISESDGIILEGEDFYADIRFSQTASELKINLEARSESTLGVVYKQIKELIENS